MKTTENDIIDLLLGELEPGREALIHQALESDAQLAALHAEWAAILPAIHSEAERVKAIQQRAIARTMLRLREECPETFPERTAIRVFHLRPARMLTAIAACLLVLSLGFVGTRFFDTIRPAIDQSQGVTPVDDHGETIYVAFSRQSDTRDGTSANPFASIAEGIEALGDGGILKIESGSTHEAVTISTSVRLIAANGKVRIGRAY